MGWIKIKNKMPPRSDEYLVYGLAHGDEHLTIYIANYFDDTLEFCVADDWDTKITHITHWMNLPNVPSDGI